MLACRSRFKVYVVMRRRQRELCIGRIARLLPKCFESSTETLNLAKAPCHEMGEGALVPVVRLFRDIGGAKPYCSPL